MAVTGRSSSTCVQISSTGEKIDYPDRSRRLEENVRREQRKLPRFHADAGCAVQLDETYLRESFKGNHKRGKFRLPRPAHHRGTPASKRGLSKE